MTPLFIFFLDFCIKWGNVKGGPEKTVNAIDPSKHVMLKQDAPRLATLKQATPRQVTPRQVTFSEAMLSKATFSEAMPSETMTREAPPR